MLRLGFRGRGEVGAQKSPPERPHWGRAGGPWGFADRVEGDDQFGDGFLVLKVLDSKGATSTEVIKVDRRPLSDALFAPPPGYTETKLPNGMTPQRP